MKTDTLITHTVSSILQERVRIICANQPL